MPMRSPTSKPLRTSRPQALVFALLLALGGTGAARAQSLQALHEAARGFDASYLGSRAQLDATQFRLDQQYALRRPSLALALSASRSYSSTPNANTQSADAKGASAELRGSQPLFNRANDKTIAQAEVAVEAARADLQSVEQDLIIRVSQAYFDVLAAQDTLATARSSLTAISELVASAKRNFEVGTATITDTREAQARFDLARATEIRAENELATRRIALDQLVGQVNATPMQLAVPVRLPLVAPANIEDWVGRVDAEHPLVRRFRLVLDIARLETEKAQAGHLPTVAVNALLGRGYNAVEGDVFSTSLGTGVAYTNNSPGRNAGVSVVLNLPLFAGYAIQNRIKETLALETRAQADLDATRRTQSQLTRSLFFGARSLAAQVAALEAAESSSQLALEATQLGFRVGVRVNLDVLNAQAQLFDTRTQLARARYDVVLANLRLRQASGRLGADDVAAVNRLLQP